MKHGWVAACAVCALVLLLAGSESLSGQTIHPSTVQQLGNGPFEWCGAGRRPSKQGSSLRTLATDCPIYGPPDIPSVRDACIPDANSPIITLRMKIHVFAEDDGSNPLLTQEDVDAQMLELNADFLPGRIQFAHETVFENDSEFYRLDVNDHNREDRAPKAMMSKYADRPASKLNVYVTRVRDLTGLAGFVLYFPWEISPADLTYGVWVRGDVWRENKILQHEVGHALGLWHTFTGWAEVPLCSECYERADGRDGDVTGDFCSDTPPQIRTSLCNPPPEFDQCSNAAFPTDALTNIMSYSSCPVGFTPQQAGRMRCWIQERLSGWSLNSLSVALLAAPEPATVGSNLVYSISVSNYGSITIEHAIVTNILAPAVCVVGTSTNLTYVQNGDLLTLDFGPLANGQSVTAELTIIPTRGGWHTNVVRLPPGGIATPDRPATVSVVTTVQTNSLVLGPILTIEDSWVTEENSGTREMVFHVCLIPPADHSLTVDCQTVDGTATAGVDYQSFAGQLTFAPGETSVSIRIPIHGDFDQEPTEAFYVNLAPVPGVFNAKLEGIGTIVRDDFLMDLVVTNLSGPTVASTGAPMAVTNAVRNQGVDNIASSFSVGIYLSADPIVTTDDFRIGSRSLSGLSAGAGELAVNNVAISSTFVPGTYYLAAMVDETDTVNEVSEDNNAAVAHAVQVVAGPDLQVEAISGPIQVGTATPILVTNLIRNIGTGDPGSFKAGIYLSTDGMITTLDHLVATQTLGALPPGASNTATIEVAIPGSLPLGNYYLGCIADHQREVTEQSELNNSLASHLIEVVPGQDLIVLGVKSRSRFSTGSAGLMTNTIHNLGMYDILPMVLVRIYFSADEFITTNDIPVGAVQFSGVPAGSSRTFVSGIHVPQTALPGTYFLGAIADPDYAIPESIESNNALASHLVDVTIGPDLVVGSVSGPSRAGTTTTISITNRIRNIGSGTASGIMVGFYLSLDGALDTNDLLLTSRSTYLNGSSDYAEVTRVQIPADLPLGSYFLGMIVDALNVTPELDETNNALLGDAIEIIRGPDLIVTALSAPTAAFTATFISVQDTVHNSGLVTLPSPFEIGFYLSVDEIVTTTDVLVGSRTVAGLGAGLSDSQTSSLWFDFRLRSGTYYLAAIADHRAQATETIEANNASQVRGIRLDIGPDLVMRSVNGPTQAVTGQSIIIDDMLENIGSGPAFYPSIMFVLSQDSDISTNDLPIGFRRIFSNILQQGQTSSGATTVVLSNDLPIGIYYLGAIADPDGFTEERDESNNVRLGPQIQIAIGPDLDIPFLDGPARAGTATSITLGNTVRNAGTGRTPAFRVNFYLSPDDTITTNDVLLGSRFFNYGLAAGITSNENTQVVVPIGLGGTFYLGAIADVDGTVVEVSEINNAVAGGLIEIVNGLDLVLIQLEAPATAVIGAQMAITDTVSNPGQTDAGSFEVAFYLSTDAVITPEDTRLGGRTIAGLAAGLASTATTVVALDPGLRAGNYYVGSIVNPTAVVNEITRTNNSRFTSPVSLEPGPDLVVNSVAGPAAATTGQTIFIDDSIANIGSGRSSPFIILHYLSTDQTITTNDVAIAGTYLANGLAAGQASSGSRTAVLSMSLAPGNYFLGAIIDPLRFVEETNESNNTRLAGTIQITGGTDLELTTLESPVQAAAGGPILVIDTVHNSIGVSVPSFSVQIYLSVDGSISTNDLLLVNRSVTRGLASGESSTSTNRLTLPVGLTAGDYWLIAKADAAEQIGERSEVNNVRLRALQIEGAPDLVLSAVQGSSSGVCGGSANVFVTAFNAGMSVVTSNFSIGVYILPDLPVPGPALKIGQTSMSGLAAGESRSVNLQLRVPCTFSGSYYLRAIIDEGNAVSELNETNNTFNGNLISLSAGAITAIERNSADIILSFPTANSQAYRLERSFDLSGPWTIVPGAEYLLGNGTTIQITDHNAAAFGTVFYRTRLMY